MTIKIELTAEQWDTLSDMVSEKRDSWARIVADAVADGTDSDTINRYSKKYAQFSGLYKAVIIESEAN